MTGRTFKTKIGPSISTPCTYTSGVPQGSVLGPLLFLIYINDLPDHIVSNNLLFADDLKVWNNNDPAALQNDLDSIIQWSQDWALPINEGKCAHMSVGGASQHTFCLGNSQRRSKIQKWLSEDLSFGFHHEQAAKRAYRVLGMVRRTFKRLQPSSFQTIYGTYIRPHLEYARQVVHTGLKKDDNFLEQVQRKATKSIAGLKNATYEKRLEHLGLFTLDYRRVRGDLIMTFLLFQHNLQDKLFQLAPDNKNRGHNKKIFKQRPRTFVRQHFFSHRVVSIWNDLPEELVNASNLTNFKALLDKFLPSYLL